MEIDVTKDIPALPRRNDYHESIDMQKARAEYFGGAPAMNVRFYIGAVKDFTNSEEDCPVYVERIMVAQQLLGEPGPPQIITVNADFNGGDSDHRRRFPREWELFERNKDRVTIPLESLPQMRPGIREALRELNINTLADVLEKPLPERYAHYKKWAEWIQSVHDSANGKPKRKVAA